MDGKSEMGKAKKDRLKVRVVQDVNAFSSLLFIFLFLPFSFYSTLKPVVDCLALGGDLAISASSHLPMIISKLF